MSQPVLLQNNFIGGMKRDFPRNQLPQGGLWNAVDYLLGQAAALEQRGGWSNAAATSAVTAASTYIPAGIYAPFSAGAQNLCIDEDGTLFKFTGVAAVTSVTAAQLPLQNPVFHNDLVIIPSPEGTTSVKKYDGSTYAALAATAPAARYATVYKDYTVLASPSASANRLMFSEPGDPTAAWDSTANIDFSQPIKGVAALRNVILVFHSATVSRVRGDEPPPGGNMATDDPFFQVGIADARSIAYYNERAIWASTEGVFQTDGVALDDITRRGSMKSYWQNLLAGYTSTWTIVGGVLRDFYFICLMDGSTFKDAFMIDLQSYAWTRLSNIDAVSFWPSVGIFDELYWGRRGAGMVATMSPIFLDTGKSATDGDGDAVLPTAEFAFYEGKVGLKSWKELLIGYGLTDPGSNNPTMTVSVVRTPENTSYTAISPDLDENTTYERGKVPLHFRAPGIGVKLSRTGAGDTLVYSLEAVVEDLEGNRLA